MSQRQEPSFIDDKSNVVTVVLSRLVQVKFDELDAILLKRTCNVVQP